MPALVTQYIMNTCCSNISTPYHSCLQILLLRHLKYFCGKVLILLYSDLSGEMCTEVC